jgi:hypothetical protein
VKLRAVTTTLMLTATLLVPTALEAQFTSFVAPPRKSAADSATPATVAAVQAKKDSVARMTLTDMKAWVDSVAGTSTATVATADTTVASANTAAPSTATAAVPNETGRTTAFSNGAIAPNTASPLPAYLAAGFASFAAGLVLLMRLRRRPARASR